jgi:long-chain acyl-CoA synthetase
MAMQFIAGVSAGFFAGETASLVDDIGVLAPTIFPSVPRLYNRIYGKIKDTFSSKPACLRSLLFSAVETKLANLKAGKGLHHGCYDKIFFKKVRALLGGRVRMMITGSAPIAGDVLDFLKVCFSCPIQEGYGMTETSAGTVITFADDPQTGIVGGPLQNVKIKLRDIPEMNYFSNGTKEDPTPKGEVMMWGPSIMKGYFKNPEKTAEALTADGWLMSGDVGAIYPNGALKIIDRAKNIFKLSQGEYIAPEKLENVYVKSPYV